MSDSPLGDAVQGAVAGLGDAGNEWMERWRRNHRADQPLRILDEMLRNPRYRFREAATLAQAIDDTTADRRITSRLLLALGARHNVQQNGVDSWTMDKYWKRGSDGGWSLRKWIWALPPRRVRAGRF
jgi:hypothetical protein